MIEFIAHIATVIVTAIVVTLIVVFINRIERKGHGEYHITYEYKFFKYSLLTIAAIVILCGFTYSNREGGNIPTDAEQMEIFHFHGHTYVCYRFYCKSSWADRSYGYGGASIVHDPDCKCGKGGGR